MSKRKFYEILNPFRKNAKVPDLTPTTWERIRLRGFMVWTAIRVLAYRINFKMVLSCIVGVAVIVGLARIIKWGKELDDVQKYHWQNDPCSTFADKTVDRVPLRCVPGANVSDKR